MAEQQSKSLDLTSAGAGTFPKLLAVALGLLAAVASSLVVWRGGEQTMTGLALACAVFSFLGLASLLMMIAGVLTFVRPDRDKHFYDMTIDALADACVVTDGKGRAIYANAPYLKLASKAEVSRLVGFDVLFSGQADFSEPVYQLVQAAREGKTQTRDVRLPAGSTAPGGAADGPRWVRLSVAPVAPNAKGGKVLWRLSDITADLAHQETAFSRLQFIITYLDHAPVGFFSSLATGKVDYVNATLAEWLGRDLVDAQSGTLTLDTLVGADVARQLTSALPTTGGRSVNHFAFPLKLHSGGDEIFDVVARSDFDSHGNAMPLRAIVMRRDKAITQGQSSDDFVRFMAAVPLGLAELDDNGLVVSANAAFLTLSKAIKLGAPLWAALQNADGAGFKAALAKADGTAQKLDMVFVGDAPRNVELSLVQFDAGQGRTTVFALDRTESKSLEVQLAQSQKMQAVGELASGIAHDFNNVLTPIIGFADLLLAKMRPTDPSFQDVMNIKQNANRAANLVRQLLAFSRKQTLQPKVHDLSEALSDLGVLLDRVLSNKAELMVSHGRNLWPVLVDIHQFEQVIINLAVNARDAMPKGGKLYVRTYNLPRDKSQDMGHPLPEADYVVCEVEDTGTGIAKEILDKIWAPFFTTKEVGKGTGLGLSMVYGIVKQTGGFIYCDSEVGKGTKFSIFLPRHIRSEAEVQAAVAAPAVPVREDFSGRGRILIVEDEASVRAFAVRALTARGYEVMEADSGEAALEVIADDTAGFELILSDVVMPEMDGPTMLKELRQRNITTKVIFMSGYAEEAFERNAEGPSDFAFLQKPFSLKQLVEKVKGVLG